MTLLIFCVVAISLIPLCLFVFMHTIVSLFGLLHFLFLDIWKKETWKVGWKTILLARFSGVSPEERRIRKSSDPYLESDLLYGRNTYIDQVGRSKSWTAERAKKWDAHGFKYEPAKWPMNIKEDNKE